MENTPITQDLSYLDNPNLALIPGYDDTITGYISPGIQAISSENIAPKRSGVIENMRNNAKANLFSNPSGGDTIDQIVKQVNSKINISGGFTPIDQTHDKLSDGTYIPKYETRVNGVDNNARLANQQSTFEKFYNPIIRGQIKVTRGIPMDIASFVYGVGDAITSGRFSNLYDNDFSNWVDDLDKRTDNSFTNYYTEAQSNLTNAPYLWDKVLGGAEFTARMIGSEALIAVATGGTSVAGSVGKMGLKGLAKAGRIAEAVEDAGAIARTIDRAETVVEAGKKGSGVLKNLLNSIKPTASKEGFISSGDEFLSMAKGVNSRYKLMDNLKTARFAITGSAYEAGFEARHFENEAQQAFWDYYSQKGTLPTDEEVSDFYTKLDGQANNVFGANMALLTVSNLAMFGNMLNIKVPFGKSFSKLGDKIGSKLFGQGIEEIGEKGVATAIKANIGQKALAYSAPVIKGIFTEGVFEEGGQGIASGMMKNYVASSYDTNAMKETNNYSKAFSKAFNDQFNTKEGIEEIVIGGIIGGLFGGVGGIRETNRNYSKQNIKADVQTYLNKNKELLYTDSNLTSLFTSVSRNATLQQQLDKAISENKTTETSLKQAETFVSMLESAYNVGKEGEMVDVLLKSLKGADNTLISERLGIDVNLVNDFKDSQIEGINTLLDTYKTSREFAENIFKGSIRGEDSATRSNMITGLSYAMTMGKMAEVTASNLFENVRNNVKNHFGTGELYNNLSTLEILSNTSKANQMELSTIENEIATKLEESKQKALELTNLTNSSTATDSEKSNNVNSQNRLISEISELKSHIEELKNNSDLLKTSIVNDFYSIKNNTNVSKEDLTDFQNKTKKLAEAIAKLANRPDAHDLINSMNEFNEANAYYKQFSDIANSLINPELRYSTYSHIFSRKRTKNKKLNDFTNDFLNSVNKVGRNFKSSYTGNLQNEIDSFDGSFKPSKSLVNYINNLETLTEKEQEIKDYIESDNTIFDLQLERKKLKDRLAELELKKTNVSTKDDFIKPIDDKINELKETLNQEIFVIDSEIKRLKNNTSKNIIQNLDSIIEKGSGTLEVVNKNGEKVDFDFFDIVIDGDSAEVANVKKTNPKENKGIGYEVYIELGTRLAERGITLKSHQGSKLTQGINLWNRLVKEGYAISENKSYKFINPFTPILLNTGHFGAGNGLEGEFGSSVYDSNKDLYDRFGTVDGDVEGGYKGFKVSVKNGTDSKLVSIHFDAYNVGSDRGGGHGAIVFEIPNSVSVDGNFIDQFLPVVEKFREDNYYDDNGKWRPKHSDVVNGFVKPDFSLVVIKNQTEEVSQNSVEDLKIKKARLKQEYTNSVKELEANKESIVTSEIPEGLTKEEHAEILSIKSELEGNLLEIKDFENQNNIYKNEIYSIIGEKESIIDFDKYYNSEIDSPVILTAKQEARIEELISKIRDNNMSIKSLKASKLNNDESLANQIKTFIESNEIFSNESSPYYSSSESDISMTQNEMNERDSLINKENKTDEDNERLNELNLKAEKVVIQEHLEFGGATLKDLLDIKKLDEELIENSNEPSDEVNERIFNEAMIPLVKNNNEAFSSAYVSLVYDSAVVSNAVVEGEEVERIHNITLVNLLGRFFNINPNDTLSVTDLEGSKIIDLNSDNYTSESVSLDNIAGLAIVLPNGEKLLKPNRTRSITGVAFGYTGKLADFGLKRIEVLGNNSGFDALYEINSQDGLSQVKSDFQVTINGVPLEFNPSIINTLEVGDKVDLVYLPEADYSIAMGQSIEDSVIVIRYKGENIGVLKASSKSETEWDTLKKKREAIIYNKEVKKVAITEKYLGLPNLEFDSSNRLVTHDANDIKNLGYIKPDGSIVYLQPGKKTNVNMSLMESVKKDGTVTPFGIITYGKEKFAIPIIIESEADNKVILLEEILDKDINDAKKINEINKMLSENSLYNSENKVNLSNISDVQHLDKLRSILENSEKIVNISDHTLYKKANKRTILDLNNPFGASKFKLDIKNIKEKPKNTTTKGKPNKKVVEEGKDIANENKCKNNAK